MQLDIENVIMFTIKHLQIILISALNNSYGVYMPFNK